jgi:hypothetical protein
MSVKRTLMQRGALDCGKHRETLLLAAGAATVGADAHGILIILDAKRSLRGSRFVIDGKLAS